MHPFTLERPRDLPGALAFGASSFHPQLGGFSATGAKMRHPEASSTAGKVLCHAGMDREAIRKLEQPGTKAQWRGFGLMIGPVRSPAAQMSVSDPKRTFAAPASIGYAQATSCRSPGLATDVIAFALVSRSRD